MRHLSGLALGLAIGVTTLLTNPAALHADEDGTPVLIVNEVPPERAAMTVETTTTNSTVIVSGALTFGLSYGAAVLAASLSDTEADRRLYVPLLGPWLDLADRPECPVATMECDGETTTKILLVADGVVQAVGVAAIIYGILTPRRHTVITESRTGVHVVPVSFGHGSTGLGLTGTF